MRVRCKRSGGYHLTVGKIYDVTIGKNALNGFLNGYYVVSNDNNFEFYAEIELFEDISILRYRKLIRLGI